MRSCSMTMPWCYSLSRCGSGTLVTNNGWPACPVLPADMLLFDNVPQFGALIVAGVWRG
jgi:hypothetical protein